MPLTWKTAKVSPVFKAGDMTKPENYQPICILPVISKVAEKWVDMQLTKHLNNGHSLYPMQFGFRQHNSAKTATRYFLENIRSLLDHGGCVKAVCLDLK